MVVVSVVLLMGGRGGRRRRHHRGGRRRVAQVRTGGGMRMLLGDSVVVGDLQLLLLRLHLLLLVVHRVGRVGARARHARTDRGTIQGGASAWYVLVVVYVMLLVVVVVRGKVSRLRLRLGGANRRLATGHCGRGRRNQLLVVVLGARRICCAKCLPINSIIEHFAERLVVFVVMASVVWLDEQAFG